VEIFDSCLTTEIVQIVSSPIYKVMQAAQKYEDTLYLTEEMGPLGWPWTDTLSLQLGIPSKCSEITFTVLMANGMPQDMVDLDSDPVSGNLYFHPTLAHAPGTYNLILRGRLVYNGKIVDTRNEPFTVVIDNCYASIDLSLVTFPYI
jgi:hypothetical protein